MFEIDARHEGLVQAVTDILEETSVMLVSPRQQQYLTTLEKDLKSLISNLGIKLDVQVIHNQAKALARLLHQSTSIFRETGVVLKSSKHVVEYDKPFPSPIILGAYFESVYGDKTIVGVDCNEE